ncbi:hypothetical protein FOPE_02946 [Fonsecaea pedrosoi]|nr:hypothetical protein FOPE_02946 [Fonsecaea pedrosoi]
MPTSHQTGDVFFDFAMKRLKAVKAQRKRARQRYRQQVQATQDTTTKPVSLEPSTLPTKVMPPTDPAYDMSPTLKASSSDPLQVPTLVTTFRPTVKIEPEDHEIVEISSDPVEPPALPIQSQPTVKVESADCKTVKVSSDLPDLEELFTFRGSLFKGLMMITKL